MLSASLLSPMIIGYLLGSINSALIICKLMRLPSPRDVGSGNPGTTNVLRTGNKTAAIATLVGDILKGVIALGIARFFEPSYFGLALVMLVTVAGHVFPIYHGFRGGKGVATTLGAILMLSPLVGGLTLVTWLVVAALTRYSSLSAILAAILMPVYFYLLNGGIAVLPVAATTLLLLYKHIGNIVRLCTGKESKINFSKRS